jgi:hypothetical protein
MLVIRVRIMVTYQFRMLAQTNSRRKSPLLWVTTLCAIVPASVMRDPHRMLAFSLNPTQCRHSNNITSSPRKYTFNRSPWTERASRRLPSKCGKLRMSFYYLQIVMENKMMLAQLRVEETIT